MWEIQDGVHAPVIAPRNQGPSYLCAVIHCDVIVGCMKYSTEVTGCHKEHLSCMLYYNCSGEDGCCNSYTKTEEAQAGDEGVVAMGRDAEYEGLEDESVEDKDVDEGGGGHEDAKDGFVQHDYLDDYWE